MRFVLLIGFVAFCSLGLTAVGQEKSRLETVASKGIDFLKTKGQDADGTFSKRAGPGITALVVTAMLRHDVDLEDDSLKRGLKALEGFVKPDGGIYGNGRLMNYETCVAVLAFSEANKRAGDGRYAKILEGAKKFLTGMQYGEATGESPDDPEYGGAGYAGKGRPDLSNTAYLLEALMSLDADGDDPAVRRALIFVSRCQNLDSPHNKSALSAKINDGGFFYKIPSEEELESLDNSNDAERGLRSYGSMTYNGLKSMIYAGLTPDDVRVKGATEWIAKHYTLANNPGMGQAGLYYYFHTFGAALKAVGKDTVKTAEGTEHDWKKELVDRLGDAQGEDGSWKNSNRQWFEDDQNLATAFALLALAYCK